MKTGPERIQDFQVRHPGKSRRIEQIVRCHSDQDLDWIADRIEAVEKRFKGKKLDLGLWYLTQKCDE
jgi:hypothetical protein